MRTLNQESTHRKVKKRISLKSQMTGHANISATFGKNYNSIYLSNQL